jgi:galactokinase
LVITASAPGRVNLIGEHTDYNGGFVLPVALPLRVTVELTPREGEIVATSAADPGGRWTDHVIGPARVLGIESGFEVRVSSDIPIGAGLGSSGALGVAMVRALRDAFRLGLDDVGVARAAQRSENEFVGASSGIMDQMAASLGREGEALFIDCRSLETVRIPLPDQLELVVVHSGVRHEHATGAYNDRRRECEEAARLLGVPQLRDAGPADATRIDALPEPLSRRARHVVAENARVLGAVAALESGDLPALGELLDGSHRSLRDDYEVSTAEVDLLVDLVREQEGVHGARITGGGWGGSIVAIADAGAGHHAAALAVAEYEQRTGLDARILLPALAL